MGSFRAPISAECGSSETSSGWLESFDFDAILNAGTDADTDALDPEDYHYDLQIADADSNELLVACGLFTVELPVRRGA